MKKRLFLVGAVLALITLIVISGCSKNKGEDEASTTEVATKNVQNPKGVGRVYYDLFDTVSYIYIPTRETVRKSSQKTAMKSITFCRSITFCLISTTSIAV